MVLGVSVVPTVWLPERSSAEGQNGEEGGRGEEEDIADRKNAINNSVLCIFIIIIILPIITCVTRNHPLSIMSVSISSSLHHQTLLLLLLYTTTTTAIHTSHV